ncbi:DNA polymerase III subunit delta [Virgibacillus halodenitrificans]|uniref:DNA polymerase III subunit delta n=1 Tax=Virgibacillus halodenitrificans TaxID=1482 RepID=UPI000EF43F85|nr:DNA polymerase III subunit delta [Virgibacillus halodenitrificans]
MSKVLNDIEQGVYHNLYLIHGTETYIIDDAVKKITTGVLTEEDMEFNLSQYDLADTPIQKAIDDAETLSFMSDKKVVIVKNPIFLTGQKDKSKIEHNLEGLESYAKEPNPNTVFVLVAPYEKLDKRKKITKLLSKEAAVIEATAFNERNSEQWIRRKTKEMNLSITEGAIGRLLQNVGANLLMLDNELHKMAIYIDEEESITENTVDQMVAKTLEQNVFTLVEKVTTRKLDEAFTILYDLLRQNEEPIKILALLLRQFRIIFQSKILLQQSVPQKDIAKQLKLHPYAVKVAINQGRQYEGEELKDILRTLTEVDYKMKTGGNKQLLLEMFLTSLQK